MASAPRSASEDTGVPQDRPRSLAGCQLSQGAGPVALLLPSPWPLSLPASLRFGSAFADLPVRCSHPTSLDPSSSCSLSLMSTVSAFTRGGREISPGKARETSPETVAYTHATRRILGLAASRQLDPVVVRLVGASLVFGSEVHLGLPPDPASRLRPCPSSDGFPPTGPREDFDQLVSCISSPPVSRPCWTHGWSPPSASPCQAHSPAPHPPTPGHATPWNMRAWPRALRLVACFAGRSGPTVGLRPPVGPACPGTVFASRVLREHRLGGRMPSRISPRVRRARVRTVSSARAADGLQGSHAGGVSIASSSSQRR